MADRGRRRLGTAPRMERIVQTFVRRLFAILLAGFALTIGGSGPVQAVPQPSPLGLSHTAFKADLVLVEKRARRLNLVHRGFVFRSYRIALGRKPTETKLREGDGRTPEGVYLIDARNPNSNFHLSLHISYPNSRDMAQAATLGASPGGMIMIHGLPNGVSAAYVNHPSRDWTNGCIAVTNTEIEEIWRFVDDGTPIIIRP